MSARGSDPFVEQVRAATDIVAILSSYLELRKAGKRWKGLCPFHSEKAPSFFVNQENQTFYCFGCQKGGDVFTFLMEQEKLTFPEALRMLAEKAGIPMPQRPRHGAEGIDDRLGEAMEVAAAFYRKCLQIEEGKRAADYLRARGITPQVAERFALGWAPASWDGLLRHAKRMLPERVLVRAGLVVEGERGLYDRFRGRVLIPIRTAGGRTIAFGGRLLDAGEPKYLNSPETPLYRKGTTLFGLGEARPAIRDAGGVLVVEGYFDVISLASAGIGWAVGTCGTALTAEQAGLLRRYSENWTLLFDGDAAGRAAVLRALDAAVGIHPSVRVALCPDGSDPDSWVRGEGVDRVREALGQARTQTPLQYLEGWARSSGLSQEATLPRVADLLRRVTDPLIRDLWVAEAAGRFRLSERALWRAIGSSKTPAERRGEPGKEKTGDRLSAREREIIAAAVQQPAVSAALRAACEGVPVIQPRCLEILDWITARHAEGVRGAASLLSRAAGEEPRLVQELSFLHEETGDMRSDPADLVRRLQGWALRQRMRDLTDSIRRAEEQGVEFASLLKEKQQLAAELRRLDEARPQKAPNFP